MKVRFIGNTEFLVLTKDKIYDVISVEKDWFRIEMTAAKITYIHRIALRL